MIERMWEILTTLTEESQQAALSKCSELGLDTNRGIVSLDESFINLSASCNVLRDAIEQRKLIQLPITIQNIFTSSLEAIQKYQTSLIAGTDEVENLADAIEKLNTYIWQYGLHNLSDEVLGYQTKLNQLKAMELAASETRKELKKGIQVKENLERIVEDAGNEKVALQNLVIEATTSATQATEANAEAIDSNQKISALLQTALQNDTTSAQLLSAIKQSNTEVLNFQNSIATLVSGFTTLKSDLEANKITQEELFSEFRGYRKQIDGLLGDANRTGMAASFTARGASHQTPMVIWFCVFLASIIGLFIMGNIYISPFLESGDLSQLSGRLALTAPLIWLGWFSAKQYSYSSRLREDYAYKEAAAKSFEGYKREASEVNSEILEKLMETAIKNLGDNPIRIYGGNENHATPLQELFEKSLKDEKLTDILKVMFSKKE